MISKKDLLVAVLCTFCLTMVLFSTMPVKSAGVYDPWVDVNHDGKINVLDLIKVATGPNTAGDPALNVTIARHATYLFVQNYTTIKSGYAITCGPVDLDGYTSLSITVSGAAGINVGLETSDGIGLTWHWNYVTLVTGSSGTTFVTTQQITLPWIELSIGNPTQYTVGVWADLYATA